MFSSNATQVSDATFIEDVFSTWLYTGTGSTQTIPNGIDLAGKGGLVWMKGRSGATNHALYDTARGATFDLASNLNTGQTTQSTGLTGFLSNGFSIGSLASINTNNATYVSWTFRKQPKFFDVVTYTGDGNPFRSIEHSLGSVPGATIIKATSAAGNWIVNHRAVSGGDLTLNSAAAATGTVSAVTLPVSNPHLVGNSSGTFIAYVPGSTTYYTSTDNGASWTIRSFPNVNYSQLITSAGIYFYTQSTNFPFQAAVSSDGVSWSTATGVSGSPTFSAHNTVSGGYMLVTQNPAALYFSSNGTSFSSVTQPVSTTSPSIAALPGANSWIFSQFFPATSVYYTTSDNGASWTVRNYPSSQNWTLGGAGGYVLLGAGAFNYAWTVDGINWTSFYGDGVASSILRDSVKYLNGWFFFQDGNGRTYKTNLSNFSQVSSFSFGSYGATNQRVMYQTASGAAAFTVDTGGSLITNITSTRFDPGIGYNTSGATYVAYLFAHNAGGFGATGADNVISCGAYTGNSSATGPVVTLGYEPQWLLIKRTDVGGTGDWQLIDNMRGFVVGGTDAELNPNLANSESTGTFVTPLATGFQLNTTDTQYNASGGTYIYIAIRRGPMRTPTSGTSVFAPITKTGDAPTATTTEIGFQQVDAWFNSAVAGSFGGNPAYSNRISSRLTGFGLSSSAALITSSTEAEFLNIYSKIDSSGTIYNVGANWTATKFAWYFFRRAPGFFDVVCYTGTGFVRTVNHNLGVAPELMLIKHRNATNDWQGYAAPLGAGKYLVLNSTAGQAPSVGTDFTRWNATAPTANVFTVSFDNTVNASGGAYIAYLFASCPGVSKVGSYTGTGATQTINCGFSAGARFVLIKRTDSTGDWYVWDTARGIVAGNDPYLRLNSTAAEVTNTDWVDTAASGFELSNAAGNLVNTNGGSYIFLAIA